MSPLNLVFGLVVVAAAVGSLLPQPPKSGPQSEAEFVQALGPSAVAVAAPEKVHDVSKYELNIGGCTGTGRLFIAGYGSRSTLREVMAGERAQINFSGRELPDLNERSLWLAYLRSQLGSKLGFVEETFWSRRFVVFEPPAGCPAALVWDGGRRPVISVRD